MMNTEKAELEVKGIGLEFEYGFEPATTDLSNFTSILIDEGGHDIREVVSALKEGEKIYFVLCDGNVWNGSFGPEYGFEYDEDHDGSIYWKQDEYGRFIRVTSDNGSVRDWLENK